MQFHFSGWSHFKMRGARHIFEQQHILAFGATVHMYTSLPSHCRVRAIAKHIPRLLIFFVIFLRWFWIFFIIVRICSGFTRAFLPFFLFLFFIWHFWVSGHRIRHRLLGFFQIREDIRSTAWNGPYVLLSFARKLSWKEIHSLGTLKRCFTSGKSSADPSSSVSGCGPWTMDNAPNGMTWRGHAVCRISNATK